MFVERFNFDCLIAELKFCLNNLLTSVSENLRTQIEIKITKSCKTANF